ATDVPAWLERVRALLHRTLGEDVDLRVEVADALPTAWVDPHQLENALLNLALNARDAMERGGTLRIVADAVRVDAEQAERDEVEPGRYLRIRVRDDGRGIDPDDLARVFEPFFTTKDAGRGSGLGLSMVYGFVRQSRGHVAIANVPSGGVEATLWLPTTERPAEPAAGAVHEPAAVGAEQRILVVEDDDLVRDYVAEQLAALGYRVEAARDGSEALAKLEAGAAVDLLFTDVVMPGGVGGKELADRARALRPELPILFTSGYSEDAIVHHGRLDPGVQLLAKPYRRAELARAVDRALHGGGAASGRARGAASGQQVAPHEPQQS
ncbi:MAG: ATP-binding protein, partial [Trueperaceae bacterium]